MGFKRPFDDEEFQELPFKHPRQLQDNNKLSQFVEVVPCNNVPPKPGISGEDEGGFCKSQVQEAFVGYTIDENSNFDNKVFETSAPMSLVTSSSSEEDARSGATTQLSLSQEYLELDFPRRTFPPFVDAYSLLLDRSPRRQVPLGPNHQANVPSWGGEMKEEKLDQSDTSHSNHIIDNADEEKLMGTCIIPMPDSDLSGVDGDKAGEGRMNCICLDVGSVRCAQQHTMKAREKLIKTVGYEKFLNLGFCDMGEEIAHKWSEEEEELFHEIVYSNPVSLGRNFWKHLAAVFPSQTKKELVSYYFNVFMLRRRAAQNRSNFLDIDSDDDEWHGSHGVSYEVRVSEEDEDSAINSPFHQDIQADPGRGCTLEEEDEEEDDDGEDNDNDNDDDDDDDDDDDCDGDGGDVSRDATEVDNLSEANVVRSSDDSRLDSAFQCVDKISRSVGEEFSDQDDSCMSFELQSNMVDSCVSVDAGTTMHSNGVKTDLSKFLRNKLDGCNDLVGEVYLFEPYDAAKVWDVKYPAGPVKGVDFLPTCNIIEEIFGEGTWDNKTRNDTKH